MSAWNRAAWLLLVACLAGCCHPGAPSSRAQTAPAPRDLKDGLIQTGDVLKIVFTDIPPGLPALVGSIDSAGMLGLRYIDDVRLMATGKTTAALSDELRNVFVPRIFPRLTVTITNLGPTGLDTPSKP